jgi:uncharacterized protein (TIGR00106 family)
MVVIFSTFPTSEGERVGKYVAKAINIVDKSGLPYQTCSMGTIIEGNWDEVFGVIKKCHRALRKDCKRVYTTIAIDDRRGVKKRIKGKVNDLERILKRKINR